MTFNAQRTLGLLERAITAPEPTAALRALTALREGKTFTAIAKPLGISRQAAHRRYRDINGSPTLSTEARAALVRAREEAVRHGSHSIDGSHLLLALAGSGALALDVDAARRSFAPPALNAPAPSGLHPALHARLARAQGPLDVNALLRAALADPDARRLVDRFGVNRAIC